MTSGGNRKKDQKSSNDDSSSDRSSDNLNQISSPLTKKKSSKLSKSALQRMRKRDAFKRIDCKLSENDIRIKKLEEEIDNVLARFSNSY